MIVEIAICGNCYHKLKRIGVAADLYEAICETYVLTGCAPIANWDNLKTILKLLELRKYIVTCDFEKSHVKILPLGYCRSEHLHLFCPLGCDIPK